jgi:hypothetical protein
MTREEALHKLREISSRGSELLSRLDRRPVNRENEAELRLLAQAVQDELRGEYERMLTERVQKTLTVFEISPGVSRDALSSNSQILDTNYHLKDILAIPYTAGNSSSLSGSASSASDPQASTGIASKPKDFSLRRDV